MPKGRGPCHLDEGVWDGLPGAAAPATGGQQRPRRSHASQALAVSHDLLVYLAPPIHIHHRHLPRQTPVADHADRLVRSCNTELYTPSGTTCAWLTCPVTKPTATCPCMPVLQRAQGCADTRATCGKHMGVSGLEAEGGGMLLALTLLPQQALHCGGDTCLQLCARWQSQ